MNVCFLLGGFTGNGGIGRVTSILSNALCERYGIYALSFFDNHKENLYTLNPTINQDYLFGAPLNMTRGMLKGGIIRLRKYLKNNSIDIVIACGALYFPIAVLSCKGLKTKCICWEHSNVQNSKDHSFQLMCRHFGARHADLIVTLTKQDRESYMNKYHVNNVVQIYNPIDEQIFEYIRDYDIDSRKILSVGRLSYQKNFGMLLDVAKDVFSVVPDWTWDIYGEGDERDQIQTKILDYGLESRVFLKGQVDDLYSRYGDYALLVMTSRYEGFPMTLLEGMANGLPLISFDVLTGPREIIHDDINGYLIKPFEINQMSNTITDLIHHPKKRMALSRGCKDLVEEFELSQILREWTSMLDLVAS